MRLDLLYFQYLGFVGLGLRWHGCTVAVPSVLVPHLPSPLDCPSALVPQFPGALPVDLTGGLY